MASKEYAAAKKKPLGEGSRFAAIEHSAMQHGARCPACVAYAAGKKAHGKRAMARYSKMGRKG